MASNVKAYLANLKVGALLFLAYRRTTQLYLLSEAVFLTALYFLWRAVFDDLDSPTLANYSFDGFVAYLLAARVIARFTAGSPWGFFYGSVRTGAVLHELVQPLHLEFALLFRWFGRKISELVLTGVAFALVASVLNVWHWTTVPVLPFLLSLLLAFLCAFFFELIISVSAFHTVAQQGVHEAKALAVMIFGGVLFPLDILPLPLKTLFGYLPFQYFVYAPAQIFLGEIQTSETIAILAGQAIWALILASLGGLVMRLMRYRVNLQGG